MLFPQFFHPIPLKPSVPHPDLHQPRPLRAQTPHMLHNNRRKRPPQLIPLIRELLDQRVDELAGPAPLEVSDQVRRARRRVRERLGAAAVAGHGVNASGDRKNGRSAGGEEESDEERGAEEGEKEDVLRVQGRVEPAEGFAGRRAGALVLVEEAAER